MFEYRPIGQHLNDFTFIRKGDVWHLFHITGRAPKGSPALSNEGLAEGHATTKDFIHWKEEAHITRTSLACYAVEHNGRYALIKNLSTICWSDDLYNWSEEQPLEFTNNPAQWYDRRSKQEEARFISPRDPFICRPADSTKYIMLFCDRVPHGDIYGRGCVGAAESTDLVRWTFLPPVFHSGKHFYTESPHVVVSEEKYHLFFSISPEHGLRHAVGGNLLGPYEEIGEGNVLPAYIGASDSIRCDGKWLFFGRILEREEKSPRGRLMPGRISLPLELGFDTENRCIFAPYGKLAELRKECVLGGFKEGWDVRSGNWTLNAETVPAQNLFTQAPAGSVLGSAYWGEARLDSKVPVRDFDLECRFQMPTFSTVGSHYRGGLILRDYFRLELDAFLQTAILSDADGTVICTGPLGDFQLDRYYALRVIFLGHFIQVYLDNSLVMYLCAYGPAEGRTSLILWQGEAIFADIKIYSMPEGNPIPVFPGGEPLRAEPP